MAKGTIIEPIFMGEAVDALPPPEEAGEFVEDFLAREMAVGRETTIPKEPADGAALRAAVKMAPFLAAAGAPTTKHFPELSNELAYAPYKGRALMWKLFDSTFRTVTLSQPELLVDKTAWNVNELASYRVRVNNHTQFDLTDLRMRLWITGQDPAGEAEIVPPNFVKLGELEYPGGTALAKFELRAIKEGFVNLHLRIDGLIGSHKVRHYYQGQYWNWLSNKWDTLPHFKQTHEINSD